jgi:hypothetical protein
MGELSEALVVDKRLSTISYSSSAACVSRQYSRSPLMTFAARNGSVGREDAETARDILRRHDVWTIMSVDSGFDGYPGLVRVPRAP